MQSDDSKEESGPEEEEQAFFYDDNVSLKLQEPRRTPKDEVYASGIEKAIATFLAPELLT